jgi:hypothetical protein
LHLAPVDAFFVWSVCKPNHQNDRAYAKVVKDIEEDQRCRKMIKNQTCIGIFIIFTVKNVHWAVKDSKRVSFLKLPMAKR